MTTPRQLERRSSVAVLIVIALAVAMLVVLLVQTSRQGNDTPLAIAASRQRSLSEQLVAASIAVRLAPAQQRASKRRRVQAIVTEWRDANARMRGAAPGGAALPAGKAITRSFAANTVLQHELVAAAEATAADGATVGAEDALVAAQRRYVLAMDRIIAELESEAAKRIDGLVHAETVCVLLLLCALGLGVRLALRPTHERLLETVEALAESESRSRAVLDAMQEGVILTAASGRMLTWNSSTARILGLKAQGSEADLLSVARRMVTERGEPWPIDDLPSRVTLRTGEALTNVVLGVRDDTGDVRWLSVNTHPLVRSAGERPHAAVSIFRDITVDRGAEEERVRHEEALALQNRELMAQADALERSEALFRSLVETAGSAIIGLDMDGVVFEWNREAETLFGVARADAIGCGYADTFVTSDHRDRMHSGIANVLSGEPLRNFVGPVKLPTGERRTVLWNITPLRDGNDAPVHGLIAAGLDITEREASDNRFRTLFERSSDAHLLYDEGGVLDCNDTTLRMLRCTSKSEVLGRSPIDLSPKRQPDGRLSLVAGEQLRHHARARGFHRFEWTHQRADGTPFPVEVTLTPVRLEGREVILAVWHDIAERKAVEDALRTAKDAAESANRTKSEFMTRMNHELRTPLTAIIGFSKVLLQGKEGPIPAGAQRYAERIRANGIHLLSLINQILDVAKVEAGRMELESDTVSVDALVQETLAMLETTADAKRLVVRRELPTRIAPIVTDEGKLRQILINLVGNAIKFTIEGEVCVRVEIDPATERPVAIVVRDTGIGIAPERQARVFEPFEQGDASTRRQFGGTGLGLSIVKAFADLIGARIVVESEVGRGTSFTLWLPLTDAPARATTEIARSA